MLRRIYAPILSVIVLVVMSAGSVAHAQTAKNAPSVTGGGNGSNGLRIAPVRSDLIIKPGESQTISLYVQNVSGLPTELRGVANDFIPSADESGTPRLLLNDNDRAPSHGLKDYVDPIGNVTLQPQEQKVVKVRISIPANAAGGGYYGAIRFLPANEDASKNVSLSASVGSLVLVTVPGDVKQQAEIVSFNVSHNDGKASNLFTSGGKDDQGKGLQSTLRIKNNGNVQIAPFGKMQLKKGGKVLATYELNDVQPRGTVLPDSVRRFTTDLGDKTRSFGKYSLEGNFGYGDKGQLISAKTSFYVVPMPYLLVAIGLVLIVVATLLVAPRWLKSHDRKLLRKVRGSRKP